MTNTTRSELFNRFNVARRMVREGSTDVDSGRLSRALGVAQQQHGSHIERYGTTLTTCTCPDRRYRGVACKGMVAMALLGNTGKADVVADRPSVNFAELDALFD